MKLVIDLFTEADGKTWDLGRVQGTVAFAAYLLTMTWAYVWRGQAFDPQAVGIGLAAVMAGYGGMIWMKGKEQNASVSDKPRV